MALAMLGVRYFLEKFWFKPIAKYFGIKPIRRRRICYNSLLEEVYKNEGYNLKEKRLDVLAKELDWSVLQVKRWLRLRRRRDKTSKVTRFAESSWRFFYYFTIFIYGFVVLWDKPWLWDIFETWRNYPHQNLTMDVWFYYMFSLTFYWSLCISQYFDVRHKDFWQMFVHHISTVLLMSLSWVVNLYRLGTLVLLVHDSSDIFLESLKLAKYANYQTLCDILFGIFTVVWIVMRLGVFPFWIINAAIKDPPKLSVLFPAYYIFNCMLFLLLALNMYWTVLILKLVYRTLRVGKMENDIRSSSDDSPSDDSVNQYSD